MIIVNIKLYGKLTVSYKDLTGDTSRVVWKPLHRVGTSCVRLWSKVNDLNHRATKAP